MIDREQLAEALGRLDPRDREILDYSLRRRVPDEDLGEIFGGTPGDVARLRASAVETLSTELGVQRGADLGHMLKELLEPATWEMVSRASGSSPTPTVGHRPVGAEGVPPARTADVAPEGPLAAPEPPAAPDSPAEPLSLIHI